MMVPVCILVAAALGVRMADARLGMGSTLLTGSSFDDFVRKSEHIMVDFFDSEAEQWQKQSKELENAVREVRSQGCNVPIAKVDIRKDPALAEKFVANLPIPQIVWFTHGEATKYHMHLRTTKGIADFMRAMDRPAVVQVESEEEVSYYNRAVFAKIPRDSATFRAMEVVATRHMDKVAFTYIDSTDNNITYIGEPDKFTGQGKWTDHYEGDGCVPSLESWLRPLMVLSEPVPAPEDAVDDDGVVMVVGRTFEKLVLREDKDVLLLVTTQWCGVCRQFKPIWRDFAQAAKQTPSLILAKMEGDRNTAPLEAFKAREYPTLMMVKAGEQAPAVFEGNRTFPELVQFVNKQASSPMVLPDTPSDEIVMIEL